MDKTNITKDTRGKAEERLFWKYNGMRDLSCKKDDGIRLIK